YTVHHKGLLGRVVVLLVLVPEAYQHERAESHAFPSYEHHQEVVAHYQDQHEEYEQVEVGKEPPETVIFFHIAHREHVDQESDPRDHHQENRGKGVDQEGYRCREISGHDPIEHTWFQLGSWFSLA